PQTQLFRISVVDSDPRRSQAIANAVAQALIVQSPTGQQQAQDDGQRDFVNQQLSTLQTRIQDAEAQINDLQDRLAPENSAREIQDLQSQITTLQGRVATLQANYPKLLDLSRGSRLNFLTVVEPAGPGVSNAPPLLVNVVAAGMAGFLLAALAAIGLDF